ncbi:MAG: hypothetical protein ACYC5O_20635, partial [Anaerolineae bacterium]
YWEGPQAEPEYQRQVEAIVGDDQFDILRWEVGALAQEARDWVSLDTPDPAGAEARERVLAYLERAGAIEDLRQREQRSASLVLDIGTRTQQLADIDEQLATLRQLQAQDRPVVERILVSQVATVLAEQNLGWLGTSLPPPLFSFSEPPLYLVVSPRDEISTRMGLYLDPSLSMLSMEAIEAAVESLDGNTSALVSGTGGFSTWPTMLVDWAGPEWILSTIAHEWTHVYLMAYPLGQRYYDSSETTAINETVAQMVGDELGRLTLERYYPDLVPPEPQGEGQSVPADPNAFDFSREMRLTRERVDALLAAGDVAQAEQYMEERRLFFVENGHSIRRLNQAYFAFHGSYRTGPEAPSEDPVAPRLRRLRQESADVAAFLAAVQQVGSLEDLVARVPQP